MGVIGLTAIGRSRVCKLLAAAFLVISLSACTDPRSKLGKGDGIFVAANGTGSTRSSAVENALQAAVKKAAGVLSVSELKIVDGEIKHDEMLNYAPGFIRDFEIIEHFGGSDGHSVRINAIVASSALVSVPITHDVTNATVQGDKIAQQIRARAKQRRQRGDLLKHLTQSYPTNAFVIKTGEVTFKIDDNGRQMAYIPFRLTWAHTYLAALKEHLELVADTRCMGYVPVKARKACNGDIIYQTYGFFTYITQHKYTMHDNAYLETFDKAFGTRFGVEVSFFDSTEKHLHTNCHGIDLGTFNRPLLITFADTRSGIYFTDTTGKGYLGFNLSELNSLERITSVSVKLVKYC